MVSSGGSNSPLAASATVGSSAAATGSAPATSASVLGVSTATQGATATTAASVAASTASTTASTALVTTASSTQPPPVISAVPSSATPSAATLAPQQHRTSGQLLPASLRVPASLADVTRGTTVLEQGVDGVACLVSVAHFDTSELIELDALLGGHAVHDILQPLRDLGLPVPDLADPMTRVRSEREVLPLLLCYGVEGFAHRVLNTARHLQHVVQQVRRLRDQRPSPSDAAQVARLAGRVNSLAVQLKQQREAHKAEIRELKAKHATSPGPSGTASSSGTAIPVLQAEISQLRAELHRVTQERDQRAQDAQVWRRETNDTREALESLEQRLGSSCIFSAHGCMNFLMERVAFSGHWPRLLKLLEDYQHGRGPTAGIRTSMTVSARDLPSDDCPAFTPLVEPPLTSGNASGSLHPLSSGQAAQALSSLAQGTSSALTPVPSPTSTSSAPSTSGTTSKAAGKKPARLSLPAALAPSGSKKAFGKTSGLQLSLLQPKGSSQSAPSVVDLTQSSSSQTAPSPAKSYIDRIALARRPRTYTPERVRALPKSPAAKSEADVILHLPGSMDRKDVRADVWELLLAGKGFWEAVDELQESKTKHDQFGKRALVRMLTSMIYWEALDRTPWSSFVPEVYYDAAVAKIRDPSSDKIPALWEPLPKRPASSDDDDGSLLDYFSSDFDDADDDSNDEDFQGRASKTKSPVQTRSQKQSQGRASTGGKHPRSSSSPASGSKSKRARQQKSSPPRRQSSSGFVDVIEIPQSGKVSWNHYDIKVQRVADQTVGFPKYTACWTGIAALHARWDPFEYLDLLETLPWDQMWEDRIKTFVFFRRSELSDDLLQGIQVVIIFMFVWRQHYWERLHWVTMTVDYDFEADPRFAQLSRDQQKALQGLYKDRKARASDFAAKKRALVAELEKIPGYRSDVWYEPGLWVVPAATCDWILHSPQAQMSLRDQLTELDSSEPARTQWATRRSDNAFLNIVPQHILSKLMSDTERAANPLPEPVEEE